MCVCAWGVSGGVPARGERKTREDTVRSQQREKEKTKEKNSRINGLRLRASRRDMLALKKKLLQGSEFFSFFLSFFKYIIHRCSFFLFSDVARCLHTRALNRRRLVPVNNENLFLFFLLKRTTFYDDAELYSRYNHGNKKEWRRRI